MASGSTAYSTSAHMCARLMFLAALPLWFGAAMMMLASTISSTPTMAALPATPVVVWTYTIYFQSGPTGTNPNVTQMFLDQYGYNRSVVLDEYQFGFSALGDMLSDLSSSATATVRGGSRRPPPMPDVILGIDMLQTTRLNVSFKPFTLTNAADLIADVDRNGPRLNVTPNDFGTINLIYDKNEYPAIANVASKFNYEQLVNSCLADKLIVIEPSEATGEHFLMSTIALYGDPDRNLTGLYPASYGGWKGWWRRAFQSGMYVAEDWDSAFYPFSDSTTPYAMMVSYGTDSAYNECFNVTESLIRPLPHMDASGQAWAWNMYETNGVTTYATSDKDTVIRQLLDFVFTPVIQNYTYEHLYMAPVNKRSLTLPDCFRRGDPLLPHEAQWLNSVLYDHAQQEAMLVKYFATWKTEWYQLWADTRGSSRNHTARFSTCTTNDMYTAFGVPITTSAASPAAVPATSVASVALSVIVAVLAAFVMVVA